MSLIASTFARRAIWEKKKGAYIFDGCFTFGDARRSRVVVSLSRQGPGIGAGTPGRRTSAGRAMLRALSSTWPLASRVATSLTPLSGAPWASVWRRGIITINVYSPSPHSHPADFRNEVRRNEDIAASKFNKMMRTEVSQGTVLQSGRRQKRYSRFTKPTRGRRIEGARRARSPPPVPSPLSPESQHLQPPLVSRRQSGGVARLQETHGQLRVLDPVPQKEGRPVMRVAASRVR